MKKKVKLFTTIASLCLAVALMAFGVYAARSIAITANGTIKFEATDINGAWTQVVASVSGGEFTGATEGQKTSQTLNVEGAAVTIPEVKVVAADTETSPVVTITLTATFRNDADTVNAALTAAEASKTPGTNATIVITPGAAGNAQAGKTGTVTIEIKLTVKNNYTGVDAAYSVTFTAVKAA